VRPCGPRLNHDGKGDSYRLPRGHTEVQPISDCPTCDIIPAVQIGGQETPKIAKAGAFRRTDDGCNVFERNPVEQQGAASMRRQNFVLLAALAVATAAPELGRAAAPNVAIPNLSGVWAHPSIPGYEPLGSGPTSLKNLSRREGGVSNNMQLVGDYNNPILKPETAAIVKKFGEMSLAHFGYPSSRNQCWPGGVPFVFTTAGMQLLQQPNQIVFLYSNDHEVRHVRMNQSHPAKVTPTWYGDSVGHYEGDTLVVDTVGIKVGPYAMVDWFGTPRTSALHVVERYRLVDYDDAKDGLSRDAKENFGVQPEIIDPNYKGKHLQLRFTVEDKEVFATPWTATMTYRPMVTEWLETACAENTNKYGTENNPDVPKADKPDY